MTHKEHDKIVSRICQYHDKRMAETKKMYEGTAHEIRTSLRRVMDKLVQVRLSHMHDDYHTWRVVTDFDPRPIVYCLERGDDDLMIEQVAEEVKYRVIKELKSLNIQRPEDLGLER